jgi:hypothetical protein
MAHCAIIDRTVEEVVPDQLVLKRLKSVRRICLVTAMQPLPVDEISAASATLSALVRRHLLELLEAMKIVVAVGRRARDVERRWLLKLNHDEPQ